MSDEANVNESSSDQPESGETSVSDAMEARETVDQAPAGESEEARKREIRRNMGANFRDKQARKDDLTFGNVKQNTKITETKREAQDRDAAAREPQAPPEGSDQGE